MRDHPFLGPASPARSLFSSDASEATPLSNGEFRSFDKSSNLRRGVVLLNQSLNCKLLQ